MSDPFDEVAPVYDDAVQQSIAFVGQDLETFTRRKVDVLLELVQTSVGDPSGLRVLDAGCGVGVTDEMLAGSVGELHGLDTAEAALAVAAERNPSVHYSATDGNSFGYPDDHFDVTFAICVVHHVDPGPTRDTFFAELRRVTRPGGLVVVFEHNPYNPLTRLAVSRCDFDEGVELLARRVVARSLERVGVDVVATRYVVFAPFERSWVARAERRLGWLPLGAQHVVAGRVRR
jgi:ubiquinone/menaquinone biosynthesis C-methylase UbiE